MITTHRWFVATVLIASLSLSLGCDDEASPAPQAQECEPGSTLAAPDGCNTCVCPDSGIIAEAQCTALGCEAPAPCQDKACGESCDPCPAGDSACQAAALPHACNTKGRCEESSTVVCSDTDPCEQVVCEDTAAYCEGNTAHASQEGGECNPETGQCEPPPGLPPEDCEDSGQVCAEGTCVTPSDPCETVTCPAIAGYCEEGVAYAATDEGSCDPASGECDYGPLMATNCDALGQACVAGECMGPVNLCEGVVCEDTPGSCEGGMAYPAQDGGDCNPETGQCEPPPGMPPEDCKGAGLSCNNGECVEMGSLGAPCESADDCQSGHCIETDDSDLFCSESCVDECPAGWSCVDTGSNASDALFLCVPASDNLCAGVTCPGQDAWWCENDMAHPPMPDGTCNPTTGTCEYPAVGAPIIDCSATGLSCVDGACVDANPGDFGSLCETDESCDSGFCVDGPGGTMMCTQTCTDACPPGWSCTALEEAGSEPVFVCIWGSAGDLCANVSCEGQEPWCDGDILHGGTPSGVCNPETGACDYPPILPIPKDCAALGLVCIDGACAPEGYNPCADKSCGDPCQLCAPNDPDCFETAIPKACDTNGMCVPYQEDLCPPSLSLGSCEEVELPGNDPFSTLQASIADDTLTLLIQYGGGCAEHEFGICFGAFMESFPVQVNLTIGHDDNDDLCLALPFTLMTVDLSPLKSAYQQAYQSESGTITLNITAYEQTLNYSF